MQQIRHRLDNLADMLEDDFGPCPLGRAALLAWLQEQLERAEKMPGAPASAVAAMIDAGYVRWLAEILEIDQPEAFGTERDQPADQEREPLDAQGD